MKRILFLILAIVFVAGCQGKTTEQKAEEVNPVAAVLQETSQAVEVVDTAVSQSEAIVEAPVAVSQAPQEASVSGDEVISGGRWGFSVRNLQDNTVEYYASNGILLGKKSS